MKKILTLLLSAALLLSLLAGCGNNQQTPSSSASGSGALKVSASFYVMYDFASKIGGDKIELTNIIPSGTEPHDWEPSASDIVGLETADVFIYNGAGMEHWVDDVLASLQNEDLLAVEASKGVALLEGHHDHEDAEDEGEEADDHASEETSYDPHVWLAPENAKIQLKNICDAFSQADPDNQSYYQANYDKYAAEFDKLNQEFEETLSSLPNKEIVVSHEAFGYLCHAYGLTQVGVEGLAADSEPDPAKMAEIIDFVKEHNVKTIFFEELASSKVAQTVADATGASVAVLNPLEGLSDEQRQNGDDYLSVMRENLAALKAALQ